jgi:cobaltochelatase CobT
MAAREPIAFLSYVRSDDSHDAGRITTFRQRLEGEVRMRTGKPFPIFQDRNDILWGQRWQERVNETLDDVTFLIPVLTPSFFQSPACRSEFQTFLLKEKTLGVNRLILPLYYVDCDELDESYVAGSDDIADVLRSRNWTDWRPYRFKQFDDEDVATALAKMASAIKASIKELHSISVAAEARVSKEAAAPFEIEPIALKVAMSATRVAASAAMKIELSKIPIVPDIRPAGSDTANWDITLSNAYYAYTKRYDEIVEAANLAEEAELLRLHSYGSKYFSQLKGTSDNVIQKLLANYKIISPGALAVTILIDNSGSMRGTPITYTVASCLLIAEWMERLGAATEFLGFTTRAWKGGQSRELWLSYNKPANPGRLNDLRHIIYKPFSADIAISAPSFGIMLREGLLKENIDGEALLWAASRLLAQPAMGRILFVFSDGASVDDSTLSVNPNSFLEDHLRSAIESITPYLKLSALGIRHDVTRYYPNALKVSDVRNLAKGFFRVLVKDEVFRSCFARTS